MKNKIRAFGVRWPWLGRALDVQEVIRAWLGGLAFESFGNYQWMWYADMALAAVAALVNLPIREAPVRLAAQPA